MEWVPNPAGRKPTFLGTDNHVGKIAKITNTKKWFVWQAQKFLQPQYPGSKYGPIHRHRLHVGGRDWEMAAARHPVVSDLLGGQVKVEIVHIGHGGEAGGQAASGAAGMEFEK